MFFDGILLTLVFIYLSVFYSIALDYLSDPIDSCSLFLTISSTASVRHMCIIFALSLGFPILFGF